ncbi:hypothetical protein NC796_14715 [Aliifodinibius sp. S!AR15-10]|uniref:hypothetical protein n=1 Tax=Aliifodinibius sp. S!AR15-10 TaxID=2950437 RepID=UPI002856807F|nr:hypothetical protein [Aliifodinibius sp. S!AR15-10]MDR8392403.1 hypothetical protein [Aliifodinibius sp. S!AR15-10]
MKSLNTTIVICFFAISSLSAQTESKQAKIQSAMSAAPASIAESATIMDWPAEEGGEMVVLRKGTNGFTCLPDMPATSGNDPMCLDEPWMKWIDAWMNKENFKTNKMGFGYMLQGGSPGSNINPYATEPTDDNEWLSGNIPHLMILVPDESALEGLPVTPDQGGAWVMFRDTPYVHIMAPMPKHNPSLAGN